MIVASKRGGTCMKECFCSIFDTREERLVEEDGRVIYRLICNICGSVLDSRVDYEGLSMSRNKKAAEEVEGESLTF